ncbi:MAG: hypothetical protein K9H58_12700 [Bacteroidales bacterium]|nr:hypothetical protein [Bacteroidales bacterium]
MMKQLFSLLGLIFILVSCSSDNEDIKLAEQNTLERYLAKYTELETDILIACAASELESTADHGISVFFYPFHGAQEYSYFESSNADINPDNFSKYIKKEGTTNPMFNGYLRFYPKPESEKERWVILTYLTDGKIHVCDPILLKQNTKPTIYNIDLLDIDLTNTTEPIFSWEDDMDEENIIYFQVISDDEGNLISGTYTYDKHWQFYNLSNVVLNIKEQDPPQVLHENRTYMFTLMGVSEDNWVNLVIMKEFETK